jgi:hypothetical protein
MADDCGFKITKVGGLFSKKTREGVSAISGRWIRSRRLRFKRGGEKEDSGGRNRDGRGGPPLPAARNSPADAVGSLRVIISKTEVTGRKRRSRRPLLDL